MNDLCFATIESNDVAAVESLLSDGSVDVHSRIAVGGVPQSTLLILAASKGHVEIVARLLDAGARIDNVNDHRDSACHVAVRNGHTAVVEMLIARNANVSLFNRYYEIPINIAIDKKNERLVMLLIDAAMAAGTPLSNGTVCHAAAVSIDVILLLLFKHRINLSALLGYSGRTPLHVAVDRSSDAGVLKMLIEVAGVDVDARDRSGLTAAHIACLKANGDALAFLIVAGANLELADEDGDTPLQRSVYDSTEQIACLLLAAGANVHASNRRGRTACHRACERSIASLPALVAFGANLDEPVNGGVTPRQLLKSAPPTTEDIEAARRRVLNVQLSLVRERAYEICVGLQSLGLDALCTCEILLHSCGPVAPLIAFIAGGRLQRQSNTFEDQILKVG